MKALNITHSWAIVLLWLALQIFSPGALATTEQIVGGYTHSCSLNAGGEVYCWGLNSQGQLGDGTYNSSNIPVAVKGLPVDVVAITSGFAHNCALTGSGAVYCWGTNPWGNLGNGTNTKSPLPVPVSGLSAGVVAISAGDAHTCALSNSGVVSCWGDNYYGELGDGTTISSNVPIAINSPNSPVIGVDAGDDHTCAVTSNGAVFCWGWNLAGQLGDGTNLDSHLPVAVNGLAGPAVSVYAGGLQTCALIQGGTVQCWGGNPGSASSTPYVPNTVNGLGGPVTQLVVGSHACAVNSSGAAYCWGGNYNGQLGDGTSGSYSLTPVAVRGLDKPVAAILAGRAHSCAVSDDKTVKCWGDNTYGQLGNGKANIASNPVPGLVTTRISNTLTKQIFAQTAGGYAHSCALDGIGGVKCWGSNVSGELGNGLTLDSAIPVPVTGLDHGVKAIAAGSHFNCALTTVGGVKCWGKNSSGQLGNGSNVDSKTPVDVNGQLNLIPPVNGLPGTVTAITVGDRHSCALTSAGGVLCWGGNFFGELGNGTNSSSSSPVPVTGLRGPVVAINAGEYFTCAVINDGYVQCWGDNISGQLGQGTNNYSNSLIPVTVAGLNGSAVAVSGGMYHTCAILNDGTVKCWGDNSEGQLGDGTYTSRSSPASVNGLKGPVVAIETGEFYTCVLINDGTMQCWGAGDQGQLGGGAYLNNTPTPVTVGGLASPLQAVKSISVGYSHTCALISGGVTKCWGSNGAGQVGDNTTTSRPAPVDVLGYATATPFSLLSAKIEAGVAHTCAINGGSVQCWGGNSLGQLGNGTAGNSLFPASVSGLPNGIRSITAGEVHSCALSSAGTVHCWGDNSFGQLGDGSNFNHSTPSEVKSLSGQVKEISSNNDHTCAVTKTGGAYCWGNNSDGQLGDGTTFSSASPVPVQGLQTGIVAITTGRYHSCALNDIGNVLCWGRNYNGQLGNGTHDYSPTPVVVSNLIGSGVIALAAGDLHTCALISGGNVLCWGSNFEGQLGDGTNTDSAVPVAVTGLVGAVKITAGSGHNCALTSSDSIYCWGRDNIGQLGSGTVSQPPQIGANTPVAFSVPGSALAVTAGGNHTCALLADSTVRCSGENNSGQLGDGTVTPVITPTTTLSSPNQPLLLSSQTLSVISSPKGQGTVSSDLPGIDCGAACLSQFVTGTDLTLMAIPSNGYSFVSWAGDCTGTGPCTVNMTSPKLAVALFDIAKNYLLSVNVLGSGSVSSAPAGIDCGSTCSSTFDVNSVVNLSATPAPNYSFTGWSGACTDATTCAVSMDAAKTVAANFAINTYALTVQKQGNGTVTSDVGGINCGASCSATYDHGSTVTLTATADTGYSFTGWSGACIGTGSCVVSMDAAKTVTANFTINTYALTVQKQGNGTVTSDTGGINCGASCSAIYDHGSTVTLTAAADTGYSFTGWTGATCTGTAPCTVSMDAAKTVTANFTINSYLLTVQTQGIGTITSDIGGILCGSICSATYDHGAKVTLTATDSATYHFTGWTGATCTGIAPCTVTMDAAKTITANFMLNTYALTVQKQGNGTVSSDVGGINCGATCSATYDQGSTVTLTATADTGYSFTGWTAAACTGTAPCTVSMDAAKTVTANFVLNTYALTVQKQGNGTVSSDTGGINCGVICNATYDHGSTVTLTAAADTGYSFTGWSGACTGTTTCSVTVDAAKTVTANFTINTYALTVQKQGSGTVTSDVGGINCGATCNATYNYGSTVTLTATASTGYSFTGWSGACTGTGSCVVSMDAVKTVTANFTINKYTLTAQKAGSGAISSNPVGISCGSTCSASYNYNTVVALTATPAKGYKFSSWSGACTGTLSTCSVTMNAAKTVKATFK